MALWPNTDMNTVSAVGRAEPAGPQPGHGVPVGGDMTNNAPLLPFTINTRAGIAGARPPDGRRQCARHRDELPVHLAAGDAAVVQRPLPPVRVRQPHGAVQGAQQRELRHGDRRAQRRRASPSAQTRHTFDADATYLAGAPRRRSAPATPVRRSTAPFGSSRRPPRTSAACRWTSPAWLADGARRVRARQAPRDAGRRPGAAGDRRTAVAAAVRHLGPRPGSLLDDHRW